MIFMPAPFDINSRQSRHWLLLMIFAVLSTASMYFLSTGLTGFRALVWLAPIPVLLLAFNSSARVSAVIAFTAYYLGSLNLLGYLADLVPVALVLVALILPAAAFALAVLSARFFILNIGKWPAVFVFPAAWVSWEYLLATLSPHGTFGNLAYTQADFLPLMQIASITGVWAISWTFMLVPTAVAVAWRLRKNKRQAVWALAITCVVVSAVMGWGRHRLAQNESESSLKVGLAATDKTVKYFDTNQAEIALPVVRAYARRVGELAAQGATVAVLPEKFVGVAPDYADEVYRILGAAARDNSVTVVAGLNHTGAGKPRNVAVVFLPSGQVMAEYDKIHLLPGLESQYQSGTETVEVSVSVGEAGVAICKDMDFVWPASHYGKAGVGLLLVPAWDFVRDGWLHGRMAVVRGIENGYAVARSAQQGLLTVSDSRGRIIAEDSSSRLPEALLVSEVHLGRGRTVYSKLGNWFAWLNMLSFVFMIFAATVKSRRSSVGPDL